jgi:DMSO reductase anchor subunit
MVPRAEVRTYYDRPVLKEPVWRWPIPAYFFSGGLAAGSSMLAVGARMRHDDLTARRAGVVALASIAASTGFLIEDLGRPSRFANMLRVFRPSSPMNMGSWLLAGYGPLVGAAVLSDVFGVATPFGRAAEVGAAVLAPAVATYTAVLVSDTAVPLWHDARRELPYVFMGSACASAGAAAVLCSPRRDVPAARRLAVLGTSVELSMAKRMEQRLGPIAAPYHEGRSGTLAKAARMMAAAGSAALMAKRGRAIHVAGAALVLASAATERFAVFEAGRASALDPQATVAPQRARVDARADSVVTSSMG